MIEELIFALLFIIVMTGAYACEQRKDEVKLANPASVYCAENGGKTSIRIENYGDVGYCIFDDGTQCEEWAYFRGECQPGQFKATDYE